jgi:hypothetical protein
VHVAYTWKAGRVELYVDGELANALDQGWGIVGNSNPIAIGYSAQRSDDGSHLPGQQPFKGMIDDVGIWDRPLTADEIALLAAPDCVVPAQ